MTPIVSTYRVRVLNCTITATTLGFPKSDCVIIACSCKNDRRLSHFAAYILPYIKTCSQTEMHRHGQMMAYRNKSISFGATPYKETILSCNRAFPPVLMVMDPMSH